MYHEFAYKSKNNPYFFSQGGGLDKKISHIKSQFKWSTMNK